ncbi:aidB [Symbiodinium necroappetens]|uniref:AidB protein n=1 Tax=Symbiodinium necroappetens TaxID=1628268 RepID=A0A812QSW5_9DINO|nr:aidB [Symbiodinium necroappetens]
MLLHTMVNGVGGKEANDPWANFLPGRATVPPERTRPEASRNGHDGYGHDRRERTQNQSTASARRPSHASEATTRIRLGKDLAQSWTTREILHAAELHLEEFDVVHSVVALHRIAKSTDRGELRHDQRLTAVLAKLAATAATATTVSPSSNEMPHVKEVSKALWALAKVGPWADNFEGYGPRGIENGSWSGRAWTGVHRSLKALGTSAIGRLHELDSHGLSNVAWSLAVARFDQRGFVTAIARTALQLLPDFQAQGLANTAWAMAHLLAEPEGRGPERKLLECIAKEVGRNAHDFTPQGLANIGWAFATLALSSSTLPWLFPFSLRLRALSHATASYKMNECSCFSQSLLLPVTQLLPRFGALSMELREGLDRVLGELLQTQELYRAAETQQQSLRKAVEQHREALLRSLSGEATPLKLALGEDVAPPIFPKEFGTHSPMASVPAHQPTVPDNLETTQPAYASSSPATSQSGAISQTTSMNLPENVVQVVGESKDTWTAAAEFAMHRPRSDSESRRKSANSDKNSAGKRPSDKRHSDLEVIDSWAAAEMLGVTGEDRMMGRFDTLIGILVLLNAFAMALTLECLGSQSAASLGITGGFSVCDASPVLDVLEHFFVVAFGLELIYRLYCLRCDYFRDYWNWADASLVIIGVTDLYLLDPLLSGSPAHNATTLRVFRVVKLARVVRIVRALRLFRGLRVLVHACGSFLPSLSWSMALLGLCMLSGGLLIGNLLQDYISDESQDPEWRLWVWQHYGTSYRSIYTMYEMTFAGNWGVYARPVLEHVSHAYVVFYVTYITFIVFAVIRVITAIFLRETLEAANNDAELMVQEGLRRKATYIHKLESIFNAIDESQDGLIDEDEMNELFMDTRVTTYWETLDIDVMQSSALFHLLANGDGQITCGDFIDGILRCKGPARAIDQIMMQKDVRLVAEQVRALTDSLENANVIPKKQHKTSWNRHRRRSLVDDQITLLGTAKMTDAARYALAPGFEPEKNIMWTQEMRHEHLMDAVSRELAEGAGNWSQQNLANILWAFAKVAVQPRAGAVRAVVDDALLTIQSWSALNISNLTWSFAKLAVRHQELFSAVESECQQKLLHFSSQNLVNVAWAFAKVVLARQNFFEQIARRAVELAPDFNPQNCSNAVWAFAAVGLASPNLLAATARRAEELAPELQAQDLANLAWAFAKLGRRDAALEETVASEVLQKVESFSPQHLSIIVYSFAQLLAAGTTGLQATPSTAATAWPRPSAGDVRRSNPAPAPSAASMVEAILTAATKRVREFDAQGLTNLAQSLAKLEIQREGLHNALVEEAAAKVSSFTNQELAMFAWAAARLGRFAGRALRMVSKETKARLQDLTAQDLSVLVWSFARSGGEDTQDSERSRVPAGVGMLNTLTSTVMRLLHELTPQDLSTIIWGYATAGVEAASMIEAVADESVKKVAKFAPQDMANVAWGLAKLGLLHEQLLEVLCRDFVARANECQAQHLSIAAWSFAKLGVASDELFEAIAQSLAGRAGELDPQGVGNSLWAFGVLCFWHRPCVKAVGGRAVRSVSELTVQEMANVAFGLHTLLRWRRPAADDEAEDDAAMLLKLLMDFLAASGSLFCRKAGLGDGASWTDFANVAKAVSQEGAQAQSDVLKELEARPPAARINGGIKIQGAFSTAASGEVARGAILGEPPLDNRSSTMPPSTRAFSEAFHILVSSTPKKLCDDWGVGLSLAAARVSPAVLNQVRPLCAYNAFSCDVALRAGVIAHGGAWGEARLQQLGEAVGSEEWQARASEANRHPPRLETHDRFGNRRDAAEFHPSYHLLMDLGITSGVSAFAWQPENCGKSGAHVIRAALMYLMYQLDPGVCCPLTMSFAAVPALLQQQGSHDPDGYVANLIEKLISCKYSGKDAPLPSKPGATVGMSMTEKQGGSDVRSNMTEAQPVNGMRQSPGHGFWLVGHKWFTSAPMSDAFLTLAQTMHGVSCFIVPRWLPDGNRNAGFTVQRLKEKIGDKSNASSEVEYRNAWGLLLGAQGRGVRTIVEMVVHTRLDCVIGSSALMRLSAQLAFHHASERKAFGRRLLDQPLMRRVLADLAIESEAALATWLRLARGLDQKEGPFVRIAVAVAKYFVCKRAPLVAYEAMECHGGNGYVEEGPIARLFRQSPLNAIWEGSGNIICLDVLRALRREPESSTALMGELQSALAAAEAAKSHAPNSYASVLQGLQQDLASDPSSLEQHARHIVDKLAVCLQAAILLNQGDAKVAHAFLATRLPDTDGPVLGTSSIGSLTARLMEDTVEHLLQRLRTEQKIQRSAIALVASDFGKARGAEQLWAATGKFQLLSEAQDTVVAHVSWDVTCFDHTWRNSGKVYHAASQRAQARGAAPAAVPKTIEDLLAPLRQHLRRDTHPERLALLELMHAMAQAEADETLEELSDQSLRDFLKKCEGAAQVYVSQYPCVSCLAVFCQFKHRCPKIGLEVAFDNAWTSFCGRPRCQVR